MSVFFNPTCFQFYASELLPQYCPGYIPDVELRFGKLGTLGGIIGLAALPRKILLYLTTRRHREDEVKEERHLQTKEI